MKKLLLTLVTLATATAASAQIVLWNGDGKEVGSDGGFWDRANPTVVEESGNKVLKITTKANPSGWDKEHCNAALPLGDADFKGLRRLTLKMKMDIGHNVLVKLVKDGGYSTGRLLWYDETKGWNKLTFEFAAGPDNEKITDTGNTALEIWPFEDGSDALSNIGKTIYIDDIQMEGPMVNGSAIRTLSDDALSGNIAITGTLSKGKYQITWDGDWHMGDYDDYVLLNSKLSNGITSVDIKGATVSDFDGNQFFFKNPNNIVYATSEYGYSHNIVADGTTTKLILDDAHPFNAPTGFTATSVELTRNVQAGINSFYLPFAVTATEVGAAKIATWNEGVTFTTQESIDANTPFITTGATAATKLNFGEKTVVTTPTTSDGKFVGIYVPQTSTVDKYGINSAGKIQAGNSTTKCNAFRAWLTEIPAAAREITIDGDATGINSIENGKQKNDDVWYDLQGRRIGQWSMVNGQLKSGIYIINGKKVVVK